MILCVYNDNVIRGEYGSVALNEINQINEVTS